MSYPTTVPTLFTPKSNYRALDPAVPATQGWTSVEAEQVRLFLLALDSGFRNGDWQAFKDMTSAIPELAASNQMKIANIGNRLRTSLNGQAWEALSRDTYEKDASYFGIKGDGTDETAQWQDALDFFSYTGIAKTGRLILPPMGTSLLTNEVVYNGTAGVGLVIDCPSDGNYGQTGFKLKLATGSGSGKTMMRWIGANCCRMRGVSFDGNKLAKVLLWIDNLIPPSTMNASSRNLIEWCSFYGHSGTDGECIAVGNEALPNTQTSEVHAYNNIFKGGAGWVDGDGHPQALGYGFRAHTSANCKNFFLYNNEFGQHAVHASMGSSGNAVIRGGGMGWTSKVCIEGGELLHVSDLDHEGDTPDGVFGGRNAGAFINGGMPSTNASYLCVVESCTVVGPLQLAHESANFNVADTVIQWPGNLFMAGCSFRNQRWSAGVLAQAPARIVSGAAYSPFTPNETGEAGGVTSLGNWYEYADQYAPIYDTSGNPICGGNFFSTVTEHAVVSLNDQGGTGGTGSRNLRPSFGAGIESGRHRVRSFGDPWGATNLLTGIPSTAHHQKKLTYTTFLNPSGVSKYKELVNFNPGQRLLAARVKVTAAFTGVSGPVTLRIGFHNGDPGDVAAPAVDDVLLPIDITTTGVKGTKDSEQGFGLAFCNQMAGGYYPALADVNNGWKLYATVVSEDDNNLTLTGGSLIVLLDTNNDDC